MIVYESNYVIIAFDILLLNDHATFPQSISGIFYKNTTKLQVEMIIWNSYFDEGYSRKPKKL